MYIATEVYIYFHLEKKDKIRSLKGTKISKT